MRILVCIKEIQDPEIAASVFRVDEERKEPRLLEGLQVTSPFDEQAVEAALRIRDQGRECRISVLTFGPPEAQRAIKRALSMGADEGIFVSNAGMERADSVATARVLAGAIRAAGPFDLILTGRQAADWDAGIVGGGVAELLRIPAVTFAKRVEIQEGHVVVERVLDDGFETVETPMPCLVTISNELGEPRKASLRETMRAAKKPTKALDLGSIGVEPASAPLQTREHLFIPVKNIQCEFVTGSSAQEVAQGVVSLLSGSKLL